ncbi:MULTISPECIES: hypothetical protein [unclassified Brevibacillus]|uniref:hypothetical protein n=1 Tax=Brevibacillus TaxID=55080 RepID=UPI000EEB7B1A|nr:MULTISPECIES: hypothetical protein [unclassified Brevibacillus]UED69226.1 hypothetical protein HP435_00520 [Brevibacillus sp. HD3.3A]HBZ82579.1 hypothetical protein [Brevibacillus sp.]
MKKRIVIPIFLILIAYVISQQIYFPGFKVWSFDELALIDKSKVNSIKLRNTEGGTVHITDPNEIKRIWEIFDKMELSYRKNGHDIKQRNINEEPKYFIEFEKDEELLEMIYISGNSYMHVLGYSNEDSPVFEIVNRPTLEFENLIQSSTP